MEVRYDAARYPVRSVDGGGGTWRTDGNVYTVLEVGADPGGHNWFRVEADDGTPALFDTRNFVLVDDSVSPAWRAELLDNGSVTFGPAEFLRLGFWEAFFDRDGAAVAAYRTVVDKCRKATE